MGPFVGRLASLVLEAMLASFCHFGLHAHSNSPSNSRSRSVLESARALTLCTLAPSQARKFTYTTGVRCAFMGPFVGRLASLVLEAMLASFCHFGSHGHSNSPSNSRSRSLLESARTLTLHPCNPAPSQARVRVWWR